MSQRFITGTPILFNIWIAKGFGIVKLQYPAAIFNTFSTWELKSYDPYNPVDSFTIDKFPNFDGLSWSYEVFDGATLTYDTILVQVAESSTVALWNYTRSDTSWQEIVSLEGTVAKFFHPDNIIAPFKTYHFPIQVGKTWATFPLGNTSTVLSGNPLIVPAGRFFPSYEIETRYNCGGECIHWEREWIAPSVGVVQKIIVDEQLGIIETWKLIGYAMP